MTGVQTCALPISDVSLCAPVERQEVWAAGVTYLRSKTARMEESDFSATAYDKVYSAERPELFFKSLAEKVVGPGESWFEMPGAHHMVSSNASATEPAKFLVVFIAGDKDELVTLDK